MKRFGLLIIAAVLGSALTLLTASYLERDKEGVKIEHLTTPIAQVAYT